MAQVIWMLIAITLIGAGIVASNKLSLALGTTMFLLPCGIAILHYLKGKEQP